MPAATPVRRRRLRSDAAENQERILAAAVRAILREGRQVPLATIAAEAGVGVGTLYRRYADRDALIAALELRAYGLVGDLLEELEGSEGTGAELVERLLLRTIDHRDQLVLPYHGAPVTGGADVEAAQRRIGSLMAALLERGRRDGTIRPDVTVRDVIVFGAMIAQPLSHLPGWDEAAQRQAHLFLRAIRPAADGAGG